MWPCGRDWSGTTRSSPPDREIFLRRYYLYEKVNDIATRLNLSAKVVEHKLARGRQRLREKLMKRGVSL